MYRIEIDNEAVEEHYNVIEPLLESITSIDANFLSNDFLYKTKGFRLSNNEQLLAFEFIHNYLGVNEKLKQIIKASPTELRNIISEVKNRFPEILKSRSNLNKLFQNVFIFNGYDDERFIKYDFINRLNLNTCPYCNRSYIYITTKNGVKPQLDHFYPKSKYPFLALSFYNLIPSCPVCNGVNAKHSKDPLDVRYTMINPYEVNNDDFKFSYKLKSVDFKNSKITEENIEVYIVNQQRIKKHISVFKLDELYQKHGDHVAELIYRSKFQYTEEYRKSLRDSGINFTDEEINRFILGNYAEGDLVHKRPLARLYQDIGKELGLIK